MVIILRGLYEFSFILLLLSPLSFDDLIKGRMARFFQSGCGGGYVCVCVRDVFLRFFFEN